MYLLYYKPDLVYFIIARCKNITFEWKVTSLSFGIIITSVSLFYKQTNKLQVETLSNNKYLKKYYSSISGKAKLITVAVFLNKLETSDESTSKIQSRQHFFFNKTISNCSQHLRKRFVFKITLYEQFHGLFGFINDPTSTAFEKSGW